MWRCVTMFRAVRYLLRAGAVDLAASLAYFTVLSLFPAVALVVIAAAWVGGSEAVREQVTRALVYYFPVSQSLIEEAVENLFRSSLAVGLAAFAGIVFAANGLFTAANRAVNRVFGVDEQNAARRTVVQAALSTALATLFLVSVGVSASLQLAVRFSDGAGGEAGALSVAAAVALGAASAALPALFTVLVFAAVYYLMPSARVEWRNAVFGALAGVVLFEAGKHLFFWFTGVAAGRNAVYGPIASFVVLLTWGYAAGMVFLYGAALTRAAGELRPSRRPPPRRTGRR